MKGWIGGPTPPPLYPAPASAASGRSVGWKRWLCGNVQATCVQTLSTQEYASADTRLLAPGQSLPAGSLRANRDELTAAYLAANNCARRIRLRRRTNKEAGFSQPQRGKGFTLAFWCSRTIARTSVDRISWRDIISSGFHKRRRFITCLMPYVRGYQQTTCAAKRQLEVVCPCGPTC